MIMLIRNRKDLTDAQNVIRRSLITALPTLPWRQIGFSSNKDGTELALRQRTWGTYSDRVMKIMDGADGSGRYYVVRRYRTAQADGLVNVSSLNYANADRLSQLAADLWAKYLPEGQVADGETQSCLRR